MRVYKLLNQKEFTKALFASDVFDNFLLTEFDIVKDYSLFIDGRKTSDENVSEESAVAGDNVEDNYTTWGEIRNLAFTAIKGSELPKSFKVVIKLTKENTANTLKALGINLSNETGLYLNIRYSGGELTCMSGTSTKEFMLTKDLENGWDKFIQMFFEKKGIEFEEM